MSHATREEFLEQLKNYKPGESTRAPAGKADWQKIYKRLRKTQIPLTITQIWKQYVKQQYGTSRYRTRTKLHEWADEGLALRLYIEDRGGPACYNFFFGDLTEEEKSVIPEAVNYNPK